MKEERKIDVYVESGDILKGKYDVICHQVNCKGVMGAGLARQIRDKYPEVFTSYTNFIKKYKEFNEPLLGHIDIVPLPKGKHCVNMFAQDNYGRSGVYTDYDAFKKCLDELKFTLRSLDENKVVAFPYGIGCGLAGGDWSTIHYMLQVFAAEVKQKVVIVRWLNLK